MIPKLSGVGESIVGKYRAPRVLVGLLIAAAASGCWHDIELPVNIGSLGGQVRRTRTRGRRR